MAEKRFDAKSTRQQKIIELVSKYDIETQDDLINSLRDAGFYVTQATVSRDIKELKLVKTMSESGVYKYACMSRAAESEEDLRLGDALANSILSVDYGENITVVKTYPGMANAVAAGIDRVDHDSVIGSVAGDDTILIVTKSKSIAMGLCSQIRNMLRG